MGNPSGTNCWSSGCNLREKKIKKTLQSVLSVISGGEKTLVFCLRHLAAAAAAVILTLAALSGLPDADT